MTAKQTAGKYEVTDNVLHLWYPRPVDLADEQLVETFFDQVIVEWVQPCPTKPYLLVNYANVHIRSNLVEAYATSVRRLKPLVLETFRYGLAPNFTGVTVALGNMHLSASANIFADERSARQAIARAKAAAPPRP